MFAPKVAKAQASTQPKTADSSTSKLAPRRSTLAARPFDGIWVEQPEVPQQPGAAPGVSWDLSKIPLSRTDPADRPRPSSPLAATPLPGAMPARLAVGRLNDPLEHEAERVAGQMMRMPAPPVAERRVTPAGPAEAPASVRGVLGAPGHPLDALTRAHFEPRFGQDFSDVSIHDDASAARSARELGALAYTAGPHVVVDGSRHHPGSVAGQHLLAHELAHVVQQRHTAPVVRRQPAPTGLPDKPPSATVSQDEVLRALTDFLTRVQTAAGTHTLVVSTPVRQALQSLTQGDVNARLRMDLFLSRKDLPSTPDEFARQAVTKLPPVIPRARVDHLDEIPTTEAKDTRPTTVGTAVGAVFDKTVAPLIKVLPISEAARAKIAEGARAAIGDGLVGLVDAAMAGSPIDDKAKSAIHAAVAAAIKQPAAAPKPQPASPFVRQAPPSAVPDPADQLRAAGVPGKSPLLPSPSPDIQAPSVNIPEGGRGQAAPPTPPPISSLEGAIQGLDKSALTPPEAREKPAAAKFADAQLFAREVASVLDAAQRARRSSADLVLKAVYRDVQDTPALFDEIERIVRVVAAALPHHASQVIQVNVQIEDTNRRRIIRLREAP